MFLVFTKLGMPKDQDQELLFLGEWCNVYQKPNNKDTTRVRVLDYHWDDRDKFNKDFDCLDEVYERYLLSLSLKLNEIHSTSFGCEYWRIIIGPWLRFFLDVVFDRYESILKAKETGLVKDSLRLIYDTDDLAPHDFNSFYKLIVSDGWNQIIFDMCAKNIGLPAHSKPQNYHDIERRDIISDQYNWKNALKKKVQFVQSVYVSNSSIPFVGVFASIVTNLLVSASAKMMPIIVEPKLKNIHTAVDKNKRDLLIMRQGKNKFEKFFETLIPLFIPKYYLESFLCARSKALNLFPKNPVKILTGTAYQANEGFKIWIAEQKIKNVPLIILQHGGNMGLSLRNQTEDHQLKVANHFLSWGWKRKNYYNISIAPALQLLQKNISRRVDGSIAVFLATYPKYFYCSYSVPFAGQYLNYIDSIIDFASNLDEQPKKLVELHLPKDDWNWGIKEYIDYKGLSNQIYSGKGNIYKKFSSARLCVITSNGTMLLETLHANMPTLILWDLKLFEIRDEAKAVFAELHSCGILHYDTASAIKFTKMIYEDPAAWWNNSSVQKARSLFCNAFVKETKMPLNQWYHHINDILETEIAK